MIITKLATLRPVGALGDENDGTRVVALGPAPGTPEAGTLAALAAALASSPDYGQISHLVVVVRALMADPALKTSGHRLTWTDAGSEGSVAVEPFSQAGILEYRTAALYTRPNGLGWSWAAVNGVTQVGAELEYALNGSEVVQLRLEVAEVSVEVYGYEIEGVTLVGGSLDAALTGTRAAGALVGTSRVTDLVGAGARGTLIGGAAPGELTGGRQ